MRVWKEVDTVTQQLIAYHTHIFWQAPERVIWMDGRPHPPGYVAHTGEKSWAAAPPSCGTRLFCSPAQSGAVTTIQGVVFSGSEDGHIRGYSTRDGSVIWDYDTAHDYTAVNGVPAKGGSLDCPGAVVAGGMLYVASGYGSYGGAPGNVLLAFSVDGQ
jgi:polyvinyl alcohol dehydrogenase (cytochrome)